MELWIRSQSKQTLIKTEKIFTEDEEVYATTNSEFNERIGVYKTKERAFAVLDEIQEMDFKSNSNVKLTTYGYVYEMPKE